MPEPGKTFLEEAGKAFYGNTIHTTDGASSAQLHRAVYHGHRAVFHFRVYHQP
jgi:hypothetical protein